MLVALGDVLDLDEEEMQLLWRKLATHAKRKRMRERDAAAAWMYHYGGSSSGYGEHGGPLASPGMGGGGGGGGMGGHLKMAHSFSSPVERPDVASRGTSSGDAAVAKDASPSGGGSDEDAEKKTKDLALKDD